MDKEVRAFKNDQVEISYRIFEVTDFLFMREQSQMRHLKRIVVLFEQRKSMCVRKQVNEGAGRAAEGRCAIDHKVSRLPHTTLPPFA